MTQYSIKSLVSVFQKKLRKFYLKQFKITYSLLCSSRIIKKIKIPDKFDCWTAGILLYKYAMTIRMHFVLVIMKTKRSCKIKLNLNQMIKLIYTRKNASLEEASLRGSLRLLTDVLLLTIIKGLLIERSYNIVW